MRTRSRIESEARAVATHGHCRLRLMQIALWVMEVQYGNHAKDAESGAW